MKGIILRGMCYSLPGVFDRTPVAVGDVVSISGGDFNFASTHCDTCGKLLRTKNRRVLGRAEY